MSARPVQRGDYFLLPYAGPRKKRMIKAVRPSLLSPGMWFVEHVGGGHGSLVHLASCSRISSSLAGRIMRGKAKAR